jgi:cell division septation protein DedD
MDEVMPLADRKKGLAIAMQKAKSQAKTPTKPRAQAAKTVVAKKEVASTEPKQLSIAGGGWAIQLGAFSKRSSAEALYRQLSSSPALAGKAPLYVPAGAVTRLQVTGFGSRSAAAAACSSLAKRGQACFPVANKG